MTAKERCPICTAAMMQPHPVHVCLHCHAGLLQNGIVKINQTSEFKAITPPPPTTSISPTTAPQPARSQSTTRSNSAPPDAHCSWCNKPSTEVKKLLTHNQHHICNECVSLCSDILRIELGEKFGH